MNYLEPSSICLRPGKNLDAFCLFASALSGSNLKPADTMFFVRARSGSVGGLSLVHASGSDGFCPPALKRSRLFSVFGATDTFLERLLVVSALRNKFLEDKTHGVPLDVG